MAVPTPSNPEEARGRFRRDMEIVKSNPLAQKWGWGLEPDYDGLRLYASMWALGETGDRLGDDYHIDMDMAYYPKYPPGVTFVNPATMLFDPNSDMRWFPQWGESPPHVKICCDPPGAIEGYKQAQIIRNTMVLEYYFDGIELSSTNAWNGNSLTFFATLYVLQQLLTRPYYGGRSQ